MVNPGYAFGLHEIGMHSDDATLRHYLILSTEERYIKTERTSNGSTHRHANWKHYDGNHIGSANSVSDMPSESEKHQLEITRVTVAEF